MGGLLRWQRFTMRQRPWITITSNWRGMICMMEAVREKGAASKLLDRMSRSWGNPTDVRWVGRSPFETRWIDRGYLEDLTFFGHGLANGYYHIWEGSTNKLVSDKLFIAANVYAEKKMFVFQSCDTVVLQAAEGCDSIFSLYYYEWRNRITGYWLSDDTFLDQLKAGGRVSNQSPWNSIV